MSGRMPVLWLILLAIPLAAQAGYREGFEAAEPSFRLHHHDCRARIVAHNREFGQAHAGEGCEYIRLESDRGTFIHLAQRIEPARLIDELNPTIWIRASRPGIQIMARVVLPRTKHPRTGSPLTTLIYGTTYTTVNRWQRLTIKNALSQLDLAALRNQYKIDVRGEQAYVDFIALNAYTGRGTAEIRIDELEVNIPVVSRSEPAKLLPIEPGSTGPFREASNSRTQVAEAASRVQGQLLMVGTRPFMPKIIDHNGEDFAFLQSLGFNVVRLKTPATNKQHQIAESLGLWLVSPPTNDRRRVLAWSVGEKLGRQQWDDVVAQCSHIRQSSQPLPIVGEPVEELSRYGRQLDIVRLDQAPLGTAVDLSELASRWRRLRRLSRPGAPFWAGIQTTPSIHLRNQQAMLAGVAHVDDLFDWRQLQLMTFSAVQAGARGFHFRSPQRLDGNQPDAVVRRQALELVNHQLDLIEPWLAGGEFAGTVTCDARDVHVANWRTDRARLFVTTLASPNQQYVTAPESETPFTLASREASVSDQAFLVTLGGLRPATARRSAGLSVQVPRKESVSFVVVTQDDLIRRYFAQVLPTKAPRMVELQYALLQAMARHADSNIRRLRQLTPVEQRYEDEVQAAQGMIRQAQRLLDENEHLAALLAIKKGDDQLRSVRRQLWQKAIRGFGAPTASPLLADFQTLPLHWSLVRRRVPISFGGNGLVGGGMEDLTQLTQSGWEQRAGGDPRLSSRVELSLKDPRSGRRSLRVDCLPKNATGRTGDVADVPMEIASAPVKVRRGDIVRIQGWIRIDQPIQGSPDGFVVFDTLGGKALGQRFSRTKGWQPFTMYRAAVSDGQVRIHLQMTGTGEAFLDDLTVTLGH